MVVFLILCLVVFSLWFLYGRGALIVHKHQKDSGVFVSCGIDRDSVMHVLKRDLSYKDVKEIFYDEKGDICILGKYGKFSVKIENEKIYVDQEFENDFVGKETNFLIKCAYWGNCFDRKHAKYIEELECIRAYVLKIFNHDAPVNPRKKYETMRRAHRYSGRIIFCSIAAIVLLFVVTAIGLIEGTSDMIQQSYFEEYSSTITIGDAFEDFFADTKWKDYENGATEYTDFVGDCLWDGERATVLITFKVTGDMFVIEKWEVDGVQLSYFEQTLFLEDIFESYGK